MTDNVVAIIPARGGSKGLPRKNLAMVGGLPLLARAIETCRDAGIADIVVTTDDDEIAAVAQCHGAQVVRRPLDLASDTATSEDAIWHALDVCGIDSGTCAFVQCTTPLLTSDEVAHCVALAELGRSAFTVYPHHNVFWYDDEPLSTLPRKPRQQCKPLWKETGGCYAFPVEAFMRKRSRFPTETVMVRSEYGIDIDDENDLAAANAIVRRGLTSPGLRSRLSRVQLLVLDFDGVLTDNRVLTDSDGREVVSCSKADSSGIILLQRAGVRVVCLTHEHDRSALLRCRKLGIECVQTSGLKPLALETMLQGTPLEQVCYVGNDEPDVACMAMVGVSMAPHDAEPCALDAAQVVLKRNGGDGAVREACEMILEAQC